MIKQTKFQQRIRCVLLAATCLLGVVQHAGAQATKLIDYTTTSWKYHTNNVDPAYSPADAWTAPGFDDSSWASGFGIFGRESTPAEYTDPSATYISCQCPFNTFIPQPPAVSSTYFRTHINWAGNPGDVSFLFTNYVDDAVIVYLNGAMLYNFNFRDTTVFPYPWNSFDPSGTANPLGEGVPFATNVIARGLIQGDNVLAVQLVQQGSGTSDDVFTLNLWATPPSPIVITQNLTNRTVAENRVVNMTIGVTGTAPRFQWYRDTLANPILDATNATYTIANSAVADSGDYFVVVANSLNTVTSAVSHLTVVVDTAGPILVSVKGDDTFQKIILTWDETIAQGSAIEFGNYYILDPEGNQVVVSAVDYNGSSVVLHVPTLLTDTNYSVEVDFQQDIVGNPTLPVGTPVNDPSGVVANLHTFAIAPGFTRFQAYLGLDPAGTLDSFVASPAYPDGSTFSFYTNALYWPQTANPNVEQYVMRFTGLFVAPESGTHHFDPAHDDSMRLRVFDGEDPSGTFTEMTAACCTALTGGPTLDKDLVAGNRYYYELLVREFGGGDYAGIAVTLPSAAVSSPVSPQYLAVAANTVGASVTITQQPASKVFSGATTAFALDFNSNEGGFYVEIPAGQGYSGPWHYESTTGSWREDGQVADTGHPNTSLLISPALTVKTSGDVMLTFSHRYSREADTWDGGQVRISVNGGPVTAVPGAAFTQNGYNGSVRSDSSSVLAGQEAFVTNSPGHGAGTMITSIANLGTFNSGDTMRVQFMAANDGNAAGTVPNWEIDSVSAPSMEFFQGNPDTTVTFTVGAIGANSLGSNQPLIYQWFRDDGAGFVAIPNANAQSYTFSPALSDNGARFRVTISIPGATATSAAATLTVGSAGPRLSMARQANGQLVLSWTGTSCLQETSTLNGAPIPWAASAVLNGVPFTPPAGGRFYRLISTCP